MKKSYISPATRAIQVNFQGMLAASPDGRIAQDTESSHAGGQQFSNKKEDIWGSDSKGLWD